MNLQHRPLFLFTLIYILGIVAATCSKPSPAASVWLAGVVFAGGFILSVRNPVRPMLGILGAVFAIGFIRTTVYSQVLPGDVSQFAEGKLVRLTGRVASDVETVGDRLRLIVSASEIHTYEGDFPTNGRVAVTLYPSDSKNPQIPTYGETVVIRGRFRTPHEPTNPGSLKWADYLARKRVHSTLFAGNDQVSILEPAPRTVRWVAARFKAGLTSRALEMFPPVHARLLLGILLGNYAALPLDVQAAFMKSGTMHLLAASGYNCGVIIGLFGFLMRRLTAPRASTHILLIFLVWGFTLISGGGPSIVRAAVMVTVFLSAYLLWKPRDLINVAFLAGLLILAANPLNLYDVGFQLSFAAVFSIILILPLIDHYVREWLSPRPMTKTPGRVERWILWAGQGILLAVLLSIVTALGTWPITAYYFNYVSVVSILANALTALLVIMVTAAGIIVLAAGFVWPMLGHALATVGTWFTGAMLGVVTELGGKPWSSFYIKSPSPWLIAIYYLVLLGALEIAHRKYSRIQKLAGDS